VNGVHPEDMKSFGLYHEDDEDKDDWRLRIKGNWLTQICQGNCH